MNLKLKIMLRAIRIRLEEGEEFEEILKSYPRLSEEEKGILRKDLQVIDEYYNPVPEPNIDDAEKQIVDEHFEMVK